MIREANLKDVDSNLLNLFIYGYNLHYVNRKDKFNKKFNLQKDYIFSNTVLIIDDFTKESLRTEDFNTLLENICSEFNQVILFINKKEVVHYQAKLANKDFNFYKLMFICRGYVIQA